MLKVFTLKFEESTEGFNDSILINFLGDKDIISWQSQFFQRKNDFFWTVMVEYQQMGRPSTQPVGWKTKRDESYRDLLSEGDWPLFKVLREWRGETCKAEGVPPYIICTNRQLAEIAVKRPHSLNALQEIDGIGEAKIKKYGGAIIGIIASHGKSVKTPGEVDG